MIVSSSFKLGFPSLLQFLSPVRNVKCCFFYVDVCATCYTCDICPAVSPLAPSITMARAAEMLKGEKKTSAAWFASASSLNKFKAKVMLALEMFAVVILSERGKQSTVVYVTVSSLTVILLRHCDKQKYFELSGRVEDCPP